VHIRITTVRTVGSVLIILLGLVWRFSAEIQTFIGQIAGQKLQESLATHISQIGPWILGPVYIRHCSQRTAATMLIMEAKQGSVFS
jgi:hypothetical protein